MSSVQGCHNIIFHLLHKTNAAVCKLIKIQFGSFPVWHEIHFTSINCYSVSNPNYVNSPQFSVFKQYTVTHVLALSGSGLEYMLHYSKPYYLVSDKRRQKKYSQLVLFQKLIWIPSIDISTVSQQSHNIHLKFLILQVFTEVPTTVFCFLSQMSQVLKL